jgi:hypothetical protein
LIRRHPLDRSRLVGDGKLRRQSRDARRRESQRYLGILNNTAQSGQGVFSPDGVRGRSGNRYETGTDTCPKGACGIESLWVEQKSFGSWRELACKMAGKRTNPAFKLAISQLNLKLEGVTNQSIGQLVRLLAASKFEEIGEVMYSPRRKCRHVCEIPGLLF